MPVFDLQQAITLLEEEDAEAAVRLLEEMVNEMPAYATARVLLARGYEALGQWGRAAAVWQDALHLIPNSPVIRRGLERAVARRATPSPLETALAEQPPLAEQRARDKQPAIEGQAPLHPEEEESPYPEPERPRLFTFLEPEGPGHPEPYEAEEHADHFWVPGETEPPSSEPVPAPSHEKGPHYEDLDRLISELESARIVPRPDVEEVPAPDLEDDIEDVVSETLARIYASQGQYDEAARVYELLAGQHPEDADEYMKKASEMRARASDDS